MSGKDIEHEVHDPSSALESLTRYAEEAFADDLIGDAGNAVERMAVLIGKHMKRVEADSSELPESGDPAEHAIGEMIDQILESPDGVRATNRIAFLVAP